MPDTPLIRVVVGALPGCTAGPQDAALVRSTPCICAPLLTRSSLASPSQTQCTDVGSIDSEHFRTTGLGPAQYACYNPVVYSWCPSQSEASLRADLAQCDVDKTLNAVAVLSKLQSGTIKLVFA